MIKTKKNKEARNLGFTTPALYCIKVLGAINEASAGYFDEMKISTVNDPGSRTITTLTGLVKDQSALLGMLNALNNQHFTILSIKTLDED